jgi:CO/xanthine dehydrogenase Mo-binding subunit
MVHQGYIRPMPACHGERDAESIWCCTQGFAVRANIAALLGMDEADMSPSDRDRQGFRQQDHGVPGTGGGRTGAQMRASIMQMRCGVFRATGPASATRVWVKIGRAATEHDHDGRAAEYKAGVQGSPVPAVVFASYDVAHQRVEAFDVVTGPGGSLRARAPQVYGVRCLINELATELGIDPLELRLRNAADEGTARSMARASRRLVCADACAGLAHRIIRPLAPNQGRGVAIGFWFNVGLQSSASVNLTENGKVLLEEGNPDIGGSRASLALMAAETLGVPYENVRPAVMDTASIGYSDLTGGSRTTYATGYAVIEACRDLIGKLVARAARSGR